MKIKNKVMSVLLSVVFVLSSSFTVLGNGMVSATQISDALADVMVSYGVTSVEYALMRNGEIIVSGNKGVYSTNSDAALTPDTMYGIGSVSKVFTTTAIMKLVQEKKINLDEYVIAYIPEFKMEDPRYQEITVRMLLNHSSGLMGSSLNNTFTYNDPTTFSVDKFLKDLSAQRLKSKPGEFSVYCNDGFTLAEIIVERVTKQSFTKYITNTIINPLKLNSTKTPQDKFNRELLAKTYDPYAKFENPVETVNVIGTGGIYSTAEDLVKFAQIYTGEKKILKKDIISQTFEKEFAKGLWGDVEADSSFNFGLGWDSVDLFPFSNYDIKAVSKGGDTKNYHSSLVILPEYNMSAAVVTSGGSGLMCQAMASSMLEQVLLMNGKIDKLIGIKTFKVPDPNLPTGFPEEYKTIDLPEGFADKYAGFYAVPTSYTNVSFEENNLVMGPNEILQVPKVVLNHVGDGKFTTSDGSAELSFVELENGNIYLNKNSYITFPGLGQVAHSNSMMQKLTIKEQDAIALEDAAEWSKVTDAPYLLINEKYTSQVYSILPMAGLGLFPDLPGYVVTNEILDGNKAMTTFAIPTLNGRDTFDFIVKEENGKHIFYAGSYKYIYANDVDVLPSNGKANYTIGSDGYAKWFKVGEKTADMKINIKVLKGNGGFAVYDATGMLQTWSMLDGGKTVKLNNGGYVVLSGDANTRLQVTLTR